MSADTAKRVSFQPAGTPNSAAAAADPKDDATEFTEEEIQEMKDVFSLFEYVDRARNIRQLKLALAQSSRDRPCRD